MAFLENLTEEINTLLSIKWEKRNGMLIPESENIIIKNGAVEIDSTFLYADLAESSIIAKKCPWSTTAKIIRIYLDVSVRIIRANKGEIRSFDGDRVMGIFIGESKNTTAVKCAREIDWMVKNVINPKVKNSFKSIRENDITIKHCIGIDSGISFGVRAGIRNNNDIIWIGNAPSFAAKLSDIREHPYSIFISSNCFNKLPNTSKFDANKVQIWDESTQMLSGSNHLVYKTKIGLKP